jgi:hypothetical protein
VNDEIKIEGLTEDERRALAYEACSEGHGYEDPRYHQDLPWADRMKARDRWWQVADALRPGTAPIRGGDE